MKETFGFIGLGLIGGSIARAIRKALPDAEIYAYDPDTISVKIAIQDGVVNGTLPAPASGGTAPAVPQAAGGAGPAVPQAESGTDSGSDCELPHLTVLFLCAPVLANEENLAAVRHYLAPDTILTDVGSVKSGIHKAVEKAGLSGQFIGGHPMAGSERIGYRNSKAQILENAYYILTPDKDCPSPMREYMTELVRKMGALPLTVTYEQHDYITAAISHLPHVISAALVNLVKESDSEDELMKTIAAGGFKDITRISSSSPEMWEHILMANPDNIRILLDRYIDSLTAFREHLVSGDAKVMYDYFDSARRYRDSFSEVSSGPIKKVHILYIDIDDQPGVIAELAVILANRQISIKNIGITHNREESSGVLGIEFGTAKEEEQARFVLISKGYTVH